MSENKRTVTGRMLLMDDTELSISFRGAKDKRHQIEVLADLNVCTPFAIAQRLEGMGCFDGLDLRAEQFSRQFAPVNASRKYPTHRPEPRKAAAFLTVGEFLTTLTELLTPAAAKARLVINGTPVSDVALIIRNDDHQLVIELETISPKI